MIENLIPIEGRNLQCGSCGHVWFFKNEEKNLELKTEIIPNNEIESDKKIQKKIDINKKDLRDEIINNTDKALIKYEEGPKITLTNLLGYIVVSILSFIALIILLDTFQIQLSSIFPNLELLLYNLYETMKDMLLFVKDLIK
ncbi:MAG: hypothetical protein CM15mP109_15350 [Candidatus Dadabacteria bacterium]|nr:MAG: hypothetical protein CM15mP109_15350 [Candidatus Dadabacteria bacterium]